MGIQKGLGSNSWWGHKCRKIGPERDGVFALDGVWDAGGWSGSGGRGLFVVG